MSQKVSIRIERLGSRSRVFFHPSKHKGAVMMTFEKNVEISDPRVLHLQAALESMPEIK